MNTTKADPARIALAIIVVVVVLTCGGCTSDYASPFDKPDETTQPVACAASTPCQQ